MKKLVLLLLVVWALPHASRRNMLPDWIPIPSTLAPIGNSKWMDQERQRVEQMNLAAPCRAASKAMWTARTAGNSPGAVAVMQGVLSESERVALLAKSEKFFNENCRR